MASFILNDWPAQGYAMRNAKGVTMVYAHSGLVSMLRTPSFMKSKTKAASVSEGRSYSL